MLWPAVGAVAVIAAVRSDTASDLVCGLLEAVIEGLTGERATISRVLVTPTALSILGVDVAHPATNDTIVHADAITASIGWDTASGPVPYIGGPVLRRVTLLRPQATLHLDPDGLREFRDVTRFRDSSPSEPLSSFPWKQLVVVSGRLHVEGTDKVNTTWAVDVDGIDVTPTAPDRADLVLGDVRFQAGGLAVHDAPIVFRDVLLTPSRLSLPEIHLALAPGRDRSRANTPLVTLDGGVDAWLGHALTGDLSLMVDLPTLTPGLPRDPAARPASGWVGGVVWLDTNLAGTPERPVVTGTVAVNGLTIHDVLPRRFGDILGPWHVDVGDASRPPHFFLEDARMTWGTGELGIDANLDLASLGIAGTVRAEDVSLAHILADVGVAPTPWVNFQADIDTHVVGTILPFRLDGPFEIALTDLEVGDAPVGGPHDTLLAVPRGSLVGDMVITADHMVLDVHQLRAGPTHGRVLADIGFFPQGPLRVDVDLPELDLSWLAPLNDLGLDGIASVQGVLGGPYTALHATGTVDGRGVVVLGLGFADAMTATFDSDMKRLDFTDIQARLGSTFYEGQYGIDLLDGQRMNTVLTVTEGHTRDLTGIFVDLGDADAAVTGSIALEGTPYNLGGSADFELGEGALWGEPITGGSARGTMTDGEFTLNDLRLVRPGESGRDELLRARGSVKRGFVMNMEVLSDGMAIERLATANGLGVTGDLQLDAQIGGTLYDWEPRGRLTLRHVHVLGEPIADSALRFDTTHHGDAADTDTLVWTGDLLGGAATATGTLGLDGEQPYSLHARFDDFPFAYLHPRAPDGSPISANLTGSLDLVGHLGDHPTPADIDGTLKSVRVAWADHVLTNEAPWVFSLHERAFSLPPVALSGPDGTRVEFAGRAAPASQVQEGLPPVLFEGGGKVDLDLLRAVVPELQEARGLADVSVRIENTAAEPVTLAAHFKNVTFRTGYFPATFENVRGDITATSRGYTLENIGAAVGGGTFTGEPSRIDAVGWTPTRYSLAGSLKDSRIQYLDYLPPMRGDARLSFDGPVGALLLAGDIHVRDMEWRDRIDWEGMVVSLREEHLTAAAPDPNDNYFGMDLVVDTRSGANGPLESTLKLRNNVADADGSCDLRIIGDTSRPGMVGEIRLDPGGRVYLNDREFEIHRAEIRYVDPFTFDPDLDVMLETDVRSQEQDYRVNYLVTGPFSDWRTTTSSDPYLSQADINALLLFGVTREELERYGGLGTALLAETGDLLLGQTALSKSFLVVDRWNLVSGVTERGTPTLSSDLRLVAQKQVAGFDVTVETALGQNLGRDWYASVERRIAQKLYLSAWLATEQEGRTLPIGAAYGLDLKLRVEGD